MPSRQRSSKRQPACRSLDLQRVGTSRMNLITVEAASGWNLFNLHLSVEACQEICFHALNTLYAKMRTANPGSVSVELPELLGAVPSCGLDACLPNARTVEQVFVGMTTRTVQTI